MFCTLGNIEFKLHTSPRADSDTMEIPWVTHELINQPGKLQPTGRNLVEKELEMYFHAEFCNVEDKLKELYDAATNYDVMALVMGNGRLIGDFVIVSISKNTEQSDELGNKIAVSVTVSLKEHVADKLQNEQKKAEKKAFATGEKKAVTNKKKAPAYNTCKGYISSFSSKLRMYQGKEQNDFTRYSNMTGPSKQAIAFDVIGHITNVKRITEENYNGHPDCINEYQMGPDCASLIQTCIDFQVAMNGINSIEQTRQHQAFNRLINSICSKATAANSKSATRKP